jgi:hypothetical protein
VGAGDNRIAPRGAWSLPPAITPGVFCISDRQRGVDVTEAYIRPFSIAMGVRHTRRCPHASTVHPIVPRAIRCRLKYIGPSNLRLHNPGFDLMAR